MRVSTLNQAYAETIDFGAVAQQERLRELLQRAVDEVARRYEHRYLEPSLVSFVLARMVHEADPTFSEALVRAEFLKSALEFTEQLDRATRGRFSLSHVLKT
ncbi:MAG: hypothetical protein WCG09_06605 [Halobacteriota archaeon]|jgi:hypothetical protein